ncbi:hypothetical protein CSPX01_16775 [Colletotrichum filicis]|nr:hypothetical protein CSPX01_16775 [Colletotrichum filicis]
MTLLQMHPLDHEVTWYNAQYQYRVWRGKEPRCRCRYRCENPRSRPDSSPSLFRVKWELRKELFHAMAGNRHVGTFEGVKSESPKR